MTRKLTHSETAAILWAAGGVVATVALQAATHGDHSVSTGCRAHRVTFVVLWGAFGAHVLLPSTPAVRAVDPFHQLGMWARRLGR